MFHILHPFLSFFVPFFPIIESNHHHLEKNWGKPRNHGAQPPNRVQLKNMPFPPPPPFFPSNPRNPKMSSPVQITPQPQTGGVARPSEATSPQTLDIVRCSRCQQSLSLGQSGRSVVQFGMNSYYCSRCATKVGFGG